MELAPGDVFAGYRIVRRLGTGGMGAVYLVDHPRLPRRDALKLLNRELSSEPDFVARFMREADIVSGLSHRNIVPVYDRGEEAGQLWLTMRYVDGIDAEEALGQAGGLFPPPRAVHVVVQVAAALDMAHRRHLIHRDVKPANVLLCASEDDEPEQVFLTDFGIAKSLDAGARITRTGLVVATFDYASPEQIEARPLDARSDVYSLGCLLYKLLTGSVPFPGETTLAPAAGHLSLPPPRATARVPWLPPALDDVIARAMAKDPADRYPTCRALAAAAQAAVDDFPAPPPPPYRVFLSRSGAGAGALIGPMRTEGMAAPAASHLVELVRRTRFFDLPARLTPEGAPLERPVTVEITAGARTHRVVADLDSARRPPQLEDLVAAVEQMPTAVPVTARPPVPPVQRSATRSRFAEPPPPLPPPAVPLPTSREQRASTATVAERTGPPTPWPTPPPVRPPATPPPHPPTWNPPPSSPHPRPARRRGRALLVAAVAAALVGAGVTTWYLLPDDPPADGGDGDAPTTTEPAPTTPPTAAAIAAYQALPRTAAILPEQSLIAPREVDGNVDLYAVGSDGSLGARLTTAPERDVQPVISPDRRNVVYVRETANGPQLWTVAVDGQGDRPLFDPHLPGCALPSRPAWNPEDPTKLALACFDGPTTTLRVISVDGVTLHELEPADVNLNDLAFSPDGRQLAYWASDKPEARAGHLYLQAADGTSEAEELTRAGTDNGPVWSPDGTSLAFSRGIGDGAREIHTLDLEDPEATPESLLDSLDGSADAAPAWSPDGQSIAFRSKRSLAEQIWIVDAEGGTPRQVTTSWRAVGTPAWGYR